MKQRMWIGVAACLTAGCASVTGTTGQSVSVETRYLDKPVAGASCELSNNKGKWFVATPGSVQIRRSNDDLIVICNKDGLGPGNAAVASETKGSMFGNILLGGGIGAIVDHNSGAAYEYPTIIQVMLSALGAPAGAAGAEPQAAAGATATSRQPAGAGEPVAIAKTQCRELGFEEATEPFRACVMKLVK